MPHDAVVALLAFVAFGWIILACIFMFAGLREGSLRVAGPRTEMVFRKRTIGRIGCAMTGILLVVGLPLQYGLGVIDAVQHHRPVPDWAYFALFFGVLMAGGFGGLMLYTSGPNALYLDLDRHTYRFLSGWPQRPHLQFGPWEDMAGVYVRRLSGKAGVSYLVGIAWRKERRAFPILGLFRRESSANALAEEMSAALELPRISPPPLGKTSIR